MAGRRRSGPGALDSLGRMGMRSHGFFGGGITEARLPRGESMSSAFHRSESRAPGRLLLPTLLAALCLTGCGGALPASQPPPWSPAE